MELINTKIVNVDFDTFRNQLTIDFSELFNFRWLDIFNEQSKMFPSYKNHIKKWFYNISYTPKNQYTKSIKQLYTNINDNDASVDFIKTLLQDIKKAVKDTNEIYNNEIQQKDKEKKLKENEREKFEQRRKSINEELNDLLGDD